MANENDLNQNLLEEKKVAFADSVPEEKNGKEILKKPSEEWSSHTFYIKIDRDYARHPAVRFRTAFPPAMAGSVSREVFTNTIKTINAFFKDAEEFKWSSTFESILWYLTFSLIQFCRKSRLEKAIEKLQEFIIQENDNVYHPIGLHIVNPVYNGLREIGIKNITMYYLPRPHKKKNYQQPDNNNV